MSSFVRNIGVGISNQSSYSGDYEVARFISMDALPTKTLYIPGESLDLSGVSIIAKYNDGTNKEITDYTTSPANHAALTENDTTINVSWIAEDGYELTTSFDIKFIKGITITSPPTKTAYLIYTNLDLSGMVVAIEYYDGTLVPITDYTVSPVDGTVLDIDNSSVTITTTINDTEFTVVQDIFVGSAIAYWGTSSAQEISDYLNSVDRGVYNISDYWAVGDERDITLTKDNSNVTVKYVIEDLDGTTSGGTKYHAIIGQKDNNISGFSTGYTTSGSIYVGYNDSLLRDFIDNTYTPAFPDDIFSLIIPSDHVSGYYSGGQYLLQNNSNVYFILYAEKEVFGDNAYRSIPDELSACKQFEYFKTTSNRIKTNAYWLRSAPYNTTGDYCGNVDTVYANTFSSNGGEPVLPFACI